MTTDGIKCDTTYFCIVDKDGNCVSLIQSIFRLFGCGVLLDDLGFFLHNRMSYFSLNPDHVNVLKPRKRTAHTLNPATVFKDDKPFLIIGTTGGDGQTQTLLQLIVALLDYGIDPQETLFLPRWRSERDNVVILESGFCEETVAHLLEKGHAIQIVENLWYDIGQTNLIVIPRERTLIGASDPRGDGIAAGF